MGGPLILGASTATAPAVMASGKVTTMLSSPATAMANPKVYCYISFFYKCNAMQCKNVVVCLFTISSSQAHEVSNLQIAITGFSRIISLLASPA
jgi:hypothetical protein